MSLFIPASFVLFPSLCNASFTDDFTVDNWLDQDSTKIGVDTVAEVLDYEIVRDDTNDFSSVSVGGIVSDTQWTLRFKDVIVTATQGADTTPVTLLIALSSANSAANSETAQDFIELTGNLRAGAGSVYFIRDGDGVNMNPSVDATFTHAVQVETVFIEINRLTATTYEVNIFSDATFTTLVEGKSGTVSSGTINLEFIKIGNLDKANAGADSTLIGTIDDVEFFDGCNP